MHTGRLEEKAVDLQDGSNYYDLLASLMLNPEAVVVFKDGVPVPFDAAVTVGVIEVLRVVSGG